MALVSAVAIASEGGERGKTVFDTSYKCQEKVAGGFNKKDGVISPARFHADDEYFVTHVSDFSISQIKALHPDRGYNTEHYPT